MANSGRPRHGARNKNKNRRKKRLKRKTRHLRIYARRAKRRIAGNSARAAWHSRFWWEQRPLELSTLVHELEDAYPDFEAVRVGRAIIFRGDVALDTLGKTRRLVVIFPGPPSRVRPIVMADGPKRSRHRFYWARPSSLCLYYARDDDGLKWTLKDGLAGLIDLARVHLIKEAWWRVTGEWDGYEVHNRPPAGTEQKPRRPKESGTRLPTEQLRRARVRCWCGKGRYVRCHGVIPAEQERQILGLVVD
jgi:hypothetical protein